MQNSAISMEIEINAFSWGILNLGMACFVGIFISYISVVDSSSAKHRLRFGTKKKNKQGTISRPKKKSGTHPRGNPFLGIRFTPSTPIFPNKRRKNFWVIYCHTSIFCWSDRGDPPDKMLRKHLRFFHLERSRQRWPCWYSRRRRVQCPSTPSKARQKRSFIWVNLKVIRRWLSLGILY